MVINISGRGEKDIFITAKYFDKENWMNFLKEEIDHE
jgi:tryptophan synthase beta chain